MENMEFGTVSTSSMLLILLTAILAIALPLIAAIIWCKKKHEPFTTVLIGAATFMLFAIVLEKPLQNILIFPVQIGLPEHAASVFINARPVLWGIIVGLFPSGFEAMFILGITYIEYFVFAVMLNQGTFVELMVDPIKDTLTPDVVNQMTGIVEQITTFSAATMGISLFDRLFAVAFHTGASIMVFYSVKDKKKWWLYPLAIIIHTAIDGFLGLQLAGVFELPDLANELIFAVAAFAVFFAAFFLLYKKDKPKEQVN